MSLFVEKLKLIDFLVSNKPRLHAPETVTSYTSNENEQKILQCQRDQRYCVRLK